MESIITGQKIAKRRPFKPLAREAPGSRPGQASVFARREGAKVRKADFFLLDGAGKPAGGAFRAPGGLRPPLVQRLPKTFRLPKAFRLAREFRLPDASSAPEGLRRQESPRRRLSFARLPKSKQEGQTSRGRGREARLRRYLVAAGSGLGAAVLAAALFLLLAPPAFPRPEGAFLYDDSGAEELLFAYASPELAEASLDEGLEPPPAPKTLELSSYTVRKGDSIGAIARRFGLSVDTLVGMNGVKSAKSLGVGVELKIPNMDGIIYKVAKGDSLGSIAKRYKVGITDLADANDLGTAVLVPGQSVFIPGAKLPQAELKRFLGESVVWPVRGAISSYYGYRSDPFSGTRRFHAAIDIVANSGTPIKAPMDGRVADVGYNSVYGNYIILSHADGMQSLFGHMSSTAVKIGKTVAQGAVIGFVGNTGYSTGPHLHFGLFKRGSPVNPLKMLK